MRGAKAFAFGALLAFGHASAGLAAEPGFMVTTNPYTFGQAPDWMPDGVHVVHHAASSASPRASW